MNDETKKKIAEYIKNNSSLRVGRSASRPPECCPVYDAYPEDETDLDSLITEINEEFNIPIKHIDDSGSRIVIYNKSDLEKK